MLKCYIRTIWNDFSCSFASQFVDCNTFLMCPWCKTTRIKHKYVNSLTYHLSHSLSLSLLPFFYLSLVLHFTHRRMRKPTKRCELIQLKMVVRSCSNSQDMKDKTWRDFGVPSDFNLFLAVFSYWRHANFDI